MATTADLGSYAFSRLSNIPSTLSVGSVKEYIDFGHIDIENYLSVAIDVDNVPETYQNILISLGCVYTLVNMIGANADFDTVLGEFRLSKVNRESPEWRELQFYQTHLNESLKVLRGGAIHFTKAYGV